jgi:glycosyltransferase involved in cell wall biosynthesis
MRVLHVYKDYPPVMGGIEHHIRDLAVGQAARGHHVSVLVTALDRRTTLDVESGVTVHRAARLATVASAPLSLALPRILARMRPEVTHLHVPYPVGEAAWLALGRRPMVVTYHSDIVRQRVLGALWQPALRAVLRRASAVLATSPRYAATSPTLTGAGVPVTIVPLGIDPEPFESAERGLARTRFGAGPNVVFVGRLRYYKGLEVLLAALPQVPDVRLLVAGTGPLEEHLRAETARLGVAERVAWLGDVSASDLPLLYAAGDVFVLPAVARSEAFGIVLLEAMAAGLPVITTEVGTGTSFVVVDGQTGMVVPPADSSALAEALRELVGNPDKARKMGEAGHARMRERFTLEGVLDAVDGVYAEVTKGMERSA